MISSNPLSAPQLRSGAFVFSDWAALTGGSREEFYDFLTTPSNERDEFLAEYDFDISMAGRALIHTVTGARRLPVNPNLPGSPDDIYEQLT